jgi:hypothetical protein
MTETATANNPTEAAASTEASATLLATAGNGTGETQQTQTTQTQTPPAAETTATTTTTTETAAPAAAPEKYAFTAPEGTTYDSEVLEAFTGAAKEANLTQDAAQKLIEKMAPALAARQVDQVKAIHQEWHTASSADKEFGGEKLAENLGVARKALDNFGTPQLRTLLDETGLGNHPEVIRLLFRAGKAISEDKFVGGAPGGKGAVNPAAVLYDKTQTQKG